MMNNLSENKEFSDLYIPAIKRTLGECLIRVAPEKEDFEHNTDLIVMNSKDLRIACRVRRPGYYEEYGGQFTIRFEVPTGAKTEIDKIRAGWGDYFFYAHASAIGLDFYAWMLSDLNFFRSWYARHLELFPGVIPGEEVPNDDGTIGRAFDIAEVNLAAGGRFLLNSQLPERNERFRRSSRGGLGESLRAAQEKLSKVSNK